MSQKSSVPQAASFVSVVLKRDRRNLFTRLIAQLDKFEDEQLSGISQQDLAVTHRVLEKLYDRLRPS